MNIFATDPDPYIAAGHLDDVRLRKMLVETVQILSTNGLGPYKPAHKHHPCVKWAADPINKFWLLRYYGALAGVYFNRFDHTNHKTILDMDAWLLSHSNADVVFGNEPSAFQNSARNLGLGLDFTHLPVHEAYRQYLTTRWRMDKREPKWTGGAKPVWAE